MGRTLVLAFALLAAMPALAGELLVGNKSADTVWRLSLEDGARHAEIATGAAPHEIAVAPDGRTAVVTNYGHQAPGNSLTVIGRDAAQVRTFDLGTHARPHGVRYMPDGRRLLVTTEGSGSLLMLDAATGAIERAIDIGDGVGHMVALSRGAH